jgi:PTS system, glucose subfamily, IIA component
MYVIPVGVIYFFLYYFIFRWMIQHFNFKTPGREDDDEETKLYTRADYKAREGASGAAGGTSAEDATSAAIARGLGSKRNITSVDCCATRLRCSVADAALVDEKLLKATGAVGVIVKGTGVQVIYGPQVAVIKSNLETYLETAPEVEPEDAAPAALPAEEKPTAEKATAPTEKTRILNSPVTGTVHPITEAPDEAFASKMMGDGFFIYPSVGEVLAPDDGEVVFVFDTKHAIGMKSADGTEYLLHIGVDTVSLGGTGFEVFVEAGQQVKKGDRLMTFDIDYIKENAKSDACLVIFTGLPEGAGVKMTAAGEVKALDPVAKI